MFNSGGDIDHGGGYACVRIGNLVKKKNQSRESSWKHTCLLYMAHKRIPQLKKHS